MAEHFSRLQQGLTPELVPCTSSIEESTFYRGLAQTAIQAMPGPDSYPRNHLTKAAFGSGQPSTDVMEPFCFALDADPRVSYVPYSERHRFKVNPDPDSAAGQAFSKLDTNAQQLVSYLRDQFGDEPFSDHLWHFAANRLGLSPPSKAEVATRLFTRLFLEHPSVKRDVGAGIMSMRPAPRPYQDPNVPLSERLSRIHDEVARTHVATSYWLLYKLTGRTFIRPEERAAFADVTLPADRFTPIPRVNDAWEIIVPGADRSVIDSQANAAARVIEELRTKGKVVVSYDTFLRCAQRFIQFQLFDRSMTGALLAYARSSELVSVHPNVPEHLAIAPAPRA